MPPPPPIPPVVQDFGKRGEGPLNILASWLLANGVIVSGEAQGNSNANVRTVTVRWRSISYQIVQADGMTRKIEKV